jgi:hypothetical protein
VLASLVIKIEYCRALHRGSKKPSRPGSLSCLPTTENAPISRFPATTMSSISCYAPAFLPGSAQYIECDVTHSKQTTARFLPGSRIASHGSRQGTAFYPELRRAVVPSLVCHDEEKSFRAGSLARDFTCALACPGEFPAGLPRAFFVNGSVCSIPFLTETASHSEMAVTHSKERIATFLTGARIAHLRPGRFSGIAQLAISIPCVSTSQNLMLHRRPIQIFLRPTI